MWCGFSRFGVYCVGLVGFLVFCCLDLLLLFWIVVLLLWFSFACSVCGICFVGLGLVCFEWCTIVCGLCGFRVSGL